MKKIMLYMLLSISMFCSSYKIENNKVYILGIGPCDRPAGGTCLNKREVIGADSESFQELSEVYAKDKNNVYYYGEIIEGVDINTFKVLDTGFTAEDKNFYYYYGKSNKK